MLQGWEKGKFKGHGKMEACKIYEPNVQAVVGSWTKKQYAAPYQQTTYYNPSPQSEIPEVAFHYMQIVQVNSLNKEEDYSHIWSLWVSTKYEAQVHHFDCKIDSGTGCNIVPLFIYRSLFRDKK